MHALPDLHRHLDGSLRLSTLHALAVRHGVVVPEALQFTPGMGLQGALARFAITLACLRLPEEVARVAAEVCEDAEADGVTTLEIRFAPQLHAGGSLSEVVDAGLEGIGGRAGLVLCGLYGDPPELVEALAELGRGRPGVVGLDLAGGPGPAQRWGLQDYAAAFERARQVGLGRTVHAGEGRPAEEIGVAIEVLHAQRIGHGTTLLDDPRITALVVERGVLIEACPTSNVHTGVIGALQDHPLPRWLRLGVRACVNTDNTLFSGVSASEEHGRAAAIPGMDEGLVALMVRHGHAGRFVRA